MYSGLEEEGIQGFDKRSGRENPLGSCRENTRMEFIFASRKNYLFLLQ